MRVRLKKGTRKKGREKKPRKGHNESKLSSD